MTPTYRFFSFLFLKGTTAGKGNTIKQSPIFKQSKCFLSLQSSITNHGNDQPSREINEEAAKFEV